MAGQPHAPYDPVKAHKYYEEHKNLKGRKPGSDVGTGNLPPKTPASSGQPKPKSPPPQAHDDQAAAAQRVTRLKAKVATLTKALSQAEAELSKKRQAEKKTAQANSDGKSTAQEKQSAKDYRDKNKQKLAEKRQQDEAPKAASSSSSSSSSSGGSTSSSSSGSSSVSSMSASELSSRIVKIKSALQDAKRQLSSATQQLGQLAHSAISSDPMINELFTRYQSAERTLST